MLYPKPERKPKQRAKRKDQSKLYSELLKPAYLRGLARGQGKGAARCECCLKRAASQIHHKRGRLGPDLLDTRYFMGVCPECHERIHREPQWAYELGYLVSRSGWSASGDEEASEQTEHCT